MSGRPERSPFPSLDPTLTTKTCSNSASSCLAAPDAFLTAPALQHKTIESVLERGEKLDNLVERSNALSAQSKMFYKTAKKQNSCCV